MLEVKIPDRYTPGHKTTQVASEAARIVLNIAEQFGWDGEFFLRPLHQVRAAWSHPVLRIIEADVEGVRCRIRPGDSSTCWEYLLVPPVTCNGKWLGELRKYDNWFGKGVPHTVKKHHNGSSGQAPALQAEPQTLASQLLTMEKTAAAFRAKRASLAKCDQEISDLYKLAEELEGTRKTLAADLNADTAGAEAERVIESLRQLLAVPS